MPTIRSTPLFDLLDRMQQEAHSPRVHVYNLAGPVGEEDTGEARKEAAMAAVMSTDTAKTYSQRCYDALLQWPVGFLFTSEQLTGVAGRPETWGAHYNAVGAIMNGMARRKVIEKTGRMIQAGRPEMHATELAQWRLLKYS